MKKDEIYAEIKVIYAANGGNVAEIAKALKHDFGLDAVEIARALYSKDGLNVIDAKVAKALYQFNGCDLDVMQTARALQKGLDLKPHEVAMVMFESLRLSEGQIALALHSGLGLDVDDTAKALYRGCGVDGIGLAKALGEGLGLTTEEIVKTLQSHGCSIEYIANALYSRDGLGLPIKDVAKFVMGGNEKYPETFMSLVRVLSDKKDGPNLSLSAIVKVLRNLSLSLDNITKVIAATIEPRADKIAQALLSENFAFAGEIAQALLSPTGLKLPVGYVARALHSRHGCDMKPAAIGRTLLVGCMQSADRVAWALQVGCNLGANEIVKVLFQLDCGADDIAKALRDGCRLELPEIAKALSRQFGVEDVARHLSFGGNTIGSTIRALHSPKGCGLSVEELVEVMRNSLGVEVNEVRECLNDAGIDFSPEQCQSYADKVISELQNDSESMNQGIK